MNLYSVWNNRTDDIVIIDGTAQECANAMGMTLNSFYSTVSRIRSGRRDNYHIEIDRDDRPRQRYAPRPGGGPNKRFTVWNNETNKLVIQDGTSQECADAMGLKNKGTFRATARNTYAGTNHKWKITSRYIKKEEIKNENE